MANFYSCKIFSHFFQKKCIFTKVMKALKQYILLIVTLLAVSAQKLPEQTILRFDDNVHDFGHILEQNGRVSHTFHFENCNDKPVVILAVETSCGCTAAEFSKRPIMSGERSTITLTFDPTGRPGTFSKQADIYDSHHRLIASITIMGDVEPRPLTIEEAYPFEMGAGVRFSGTFLPFGYISHGERKQSYIECINTSASDVTLEITTTASSGFLSINAPKSIAAGGKSRIELTYFAAQGSGVFCSAEDIAEVYIAGKKGQFTITSNAIVVERYSPNDKFPAPQAQLNKNIANFGTLKRDGNPRRHELIIINLGGEPLRIEGVEAPSTISLSIGRGSVINAGEEVSFEIEFDPSQCDYGYYTERVRIFVNDPVRPMRQIRISASVVE